MPTSFTELMQGAQTLGANLQSYYDRKRRDRLDKEAKELADKREKRAQQTHEVQMEAATQAKNLAKAQSWTAEALAMHKAGKTEAANNLLAKAFNVVPNGMDILTVKDVNKVKPEERAKFFATNPDMQQHEGNGLIAKTFDRVNDREGTVSFKDFNSAYESMQALISPQAFMRARAEQKAWVETFNRDSSPTITLDKNNKPQYYIQRAFQGENGQLRKENIQLTPEEASKYDASIVNRAEAVRQQKMREDEKYGLTARKMRAEVEKLEGEGKGVGYMNPAALNAIRDQVTNTIAPQGMDLVDDPSAAQMEIDNILEYVPRAWQQSGGDVAATAVLAREMMDYDQFLASRQAVEKVEEKPKAKKKETPKKPAGVREIRPELANVPPTEWETTADGKVKLGGKWVKMNRNEYDAWLAAMEKKEKEEGTVSFKEAFSKGLSFIPTGTQTIPAGALRYKNR